MRRARLPVVLSTTGHLHPRSRSAAGDIEVLGLGLREAGLQRRTREAAHGETRERLLLAVRASGEVVVVRLGHPGGRAGRSALYLHGLRGGAPALSPVFPTAFSARGGGHLERSGEDSRGEKRVRAASARLRRWDESDAGGSNKGRTAGQHARPSSSWLVPSPLGGRS